MCLGFQRDDGVDTLDLEIAGFELALGGELLHTGTKHKGHVVLVSRDQSVGIGLGGLLDEGKQGAAHLLSVDDESAVEDLVAAVLRVDLGETIHLTVGELASDLLGNALEIGDLLIAEGQTLLGIVGGNVVDMLQRLGLPVDGEHLLVEVMVHGLEHGVVRGVLRLHFEKLLDTDNAFDTHVLGDLNGIGAPRGDHLAARTNKKAFHRLGFDQGGLTKKP